MPNKIALDINDNFLDQLHYNHQGLIPAIVQNQKTKEILMMAYVNRESLDKTIKSGNATFWSRSRQKLWMKGETSGNVIRVIKILIDCDGDTLLFIGDPSGPTCHTGERTCFYRTLAGSESE